MSEIILYTTADGKANIKLYADNGTVWLTQAQMAELFNTTPQNITLHIKNIYSEGELLPEATCKDFLQVRTEGNRTIQRNQKFYNLDVIIAVGFRVRSLRGTQFRKWANTTLKEYLTKGFILDSDRLKNPDGRPDYFDELLAQIRDIRASEKRFYQKLRDLFALSTDYSPTNADTKMFFAQTQNKLLFAVTGNTSAEIIANRADHNKPNMGLTSWKGSIVRKIDISTAKNYLTADEIDTLNRLVSLFLESAELRAKMRKTLTLDYWRGSVDKILQDHDIPLLRSAGKISKPAANELAAAEYEKFDARRKADEAKQADEDDFFWLVDSVDKINSNKK